MESDCQCTNLKNQIIQLKYEKRQLELEVAELKRISREEQREAELIETKVKEMIEQMKGE